MHEAPLNQQQQDLLTYLPYCGVVLDYVFMEPDCPEEQLDSESTHRNAVVLAIRSLQMQSNEYVEWLINSGKLARGSVAPMTVDDAKAVAIEGIRVSHVEFLGDHYDVASGCILLGDGYSSLQIDPTAGSLQAGNPPVWARALHASGSGYAYAFAEPPHQLRLEPDDVAALFAEVNSMLLGGMRADSIIFKWPSDWSNYFDEGHEYWGSFLWSFANPGTSRIVVIAASATD